MNTSNTNFIKKIYLKALFPNLIAVVGGTVNVFFDGILVGQKLGDLGLQGINQSMPMYLILCTIGSLIASGCMVRSAISFGKNDKKEATRYYSVGLFIGVCASIIFCVVGFLLISPISKMLSTDETYNYVLDYLKITLVSGPFKILGYMPLMYLRLEGKNRKNSISMIVMCVLNIVLDVLFLFVFDFGIKGAAWASVIATIAASVMSFIFLYTGKSNFAVGMKLPKKGDLWNIIKFGSPTAMDNLLTSMKVLCMNLIFAGLGISSLISVFAIINNLFEFSVFIQMGVPQTASAMAGIFYGEKDSLAAKRLLKLELSAGVVLAGIFGILMIAFSNKIGLLFGSSADCSFAVLCLALGVVLGVINNIFQGFYTSIEKLGLANIITIGRSFVFIVVFCYLLRNTGDFIWLCYPLAEIADFVLFTIISLFIAKKKGLSKFYLLDERLEKSGKSISFSVDCNAKDICNASEKIVDFCQNNSLPANKTMAVSLSIEEILMIISTKSLNMHGSMDIRVLIVNEKAVIRVRSGGTRYNPVDACDDNDLEYLGVRMIMNIADNIEYQSTLGINTLLIFI